MIDILFSAQAILGQVLSGRSLSASISGGASSVRLEGRSSAAAKNAVYGSLRHFGFLDFAIKHLMRQENPQIKALLVVAIYELEFTGAPSHAVVNAAVDCAAKMQLGGLKKLVNGVLRSYLRKSEEIKSSAKENLVATLGHPTWWINKLTNQYGQKKAEEIMLASFIHPPLALRVNTRKISPQDYKNTLASSARSWRAPGISGASEAIILEKPVPVSEIPGFSQGLASVQDVGAQLAAEILDLHDGQRVLDACAAPGGKSTHILERASVSLLCLDQDHLRMKRVKENLQRLGHRAKTLVTDAANLDAWWDGKPFDRILVDAPCTGSGVVRRNPDIKWIRREEDLHSFSEQQQKLLSSLWKALTKGGKLLYVTCSIFQEENEHQVEWFLKKHPNAEIAAYHGKDIGHNLTPNRDHDGFFHALLEKK